MKKQCLILLSLVLLSSCKQGSDVTRPSHSSPSVNPSSESNKPSASSKPSISTSTSTSTSTSDTPSLNDMESLNDFVKEYKAIEKRDVFDFTSTSLMEEHYVDDSYSSFSRTENGSIYLGNVLTSDGEIKDVSTSYFSPRNIESNFSYFIGEKGDKCYEILDYEDKKYTDKARVLDEKESALLKEHVSSPISYEISSFYSKYLSDGLNTSNLSISEVMYDSMSDLDVKNESGRILGSGRKECKVVEDHLSTYVYEMECQYVMEKGHISSFSYQVKGYYTDRDKKKSDLKFIDSVSLTENFQEKGEYDSKTFIDPSDYFLSSCDVVFYYGKTLDKIDTEVNASQIPYNVYLRAEARNPVPSKAVDTKLLISSSTDENVISVLKTLDGYTVRTQSIGTSTLEVTTSTGFVKSVECTVVGKPMTSITLSIYDRERRHYKGTRSPVKVSSLPLDTSDKLEFISSDTSVMKFVKFGLGGDMYLSYLKPGKASVYCRSKEHPEVKSETFEMEVLEDATASTAMSPLVLKSFDVDYSVAILNEHRTQFIENCFEFSFGEENDGVYPVTLKMVKDNVYADMGFVKNQAYPFSCSFDKKDTGNKSLIFNLSEISFEKDGHTFSYTGTMTYSMKNDYFTVSYQGKVDGEIKGELLIASTLKERK